MLLQYQFDHHRQQMNLNTFSALTLQSDLTHSVPSPCKAILLIQCPHLAKQTELTRLTPLNYSASARLQYSRTVVSSSTVSQFLVCPSSPLCFLEACTHQVPLLGSTKRRPKASRPRSSQPRDNFKPLQGRPRPNTALG